MEEVPDQVSSGRVTLEGSGETTFIRRRVGVGHMGRHRRKGLDKRGRHK